MPAYCRGYCADVSSMPRKLPVSFFQRDALTVAPELLGKHLVRRFDNGTVRRFSITDVEAYRGEEDKACHARAGKTAANEIMYDAGGRLYVYLIYGLYWLLNITTGTKGAPQGVMIRGVSGIYGPGRVGRELQLCKAMKGESVAGKKLWLEESGFSPAYRTAPRVGIDYAGEWKHMPWRFIADEESPYFKK